MDAFFKELGRTVLERWKQENFSLAKFPEIARSALDERPPARHVDLPALMRDFLLNEEQPFQTDSEFGEPELVAYSHPRFYIQLLFWMDGTTAIHQHEFSGAFHVMHGSSIHAHYAFDKAQPVTPYLRVGDVRMKEIELLESGRTVPIISGPQAIHSLFHLDSPSVTVVVRTQHDPGTGPQLNYLPPHIAVDPHFSDNLTTRRKQLLDVLEQTEDAGYAELVLEMIADLDFERGFSVLHHCMGPLQQLDQWEPVLRAFEKKHGTLAAGVATTLKEDVRRGVIKGLRSTIIEPEHRFFLALLMNAPTRDHLLALVAQRFPEEAPLAIVLRWVEELTEVSDQGVTILDASFPETLEVESEAQPELFLSALRYFLKRDKKLPPVMRDLHAADVKALQAVFAESSLSLLMH
jgi:predicted metal-dependent enzyme (double-stranded beta helix superfamily)